MFDKKAYVQIRTQLDMAPRVGPTLGIMLLDVGLLACVVRLLRNGDAVSFVAAQLLLVVVFFNSFSILHECGHGSASSQRWFNTLVGHYTSLFCFIPYYPWKYIHQQHHVWAGNLERDPVLKSLRSWQQHGVPWLVRAAWQTWVPLGALLQHGVYLIYPWIAWRSGQMSRKRLVHCAVSLIWMPIGIMCLQRLAPDVVRLSNCWLAIVLFLVAEELVNIPHHIDRSTFHTKLPVWDQHRATRSCYYPWGVSELLVLNFNFHIEHHLFPVLPWYRLRHARKLIRETLGDSYQEAIGIRWNLTHRQQDLQSIVSRPPASPTQISEFLTEDS
jgi:omega-6 fatty acid desaturase (delta-12 desaturase)